MPYIWIWVAGGTTLGIVTKTVRLERYSQQVRNQSSTNLEPIGLHFTNEEEQAVPFRIPVIALN
jgi:hypothetical protein